MLTNGHDQDVTNCIVCGKAREVCLQHVMLSFGAFLFFVSCVQHFAYERFSGRYGELDLVQESSRSALLRRGLERIKCPRLELNAHVIFKTAQAGAVIGGLLVAPISSLVSGNRDLQVNLVSCRQERSAAPNKFQFDYSLPHCHCFPQQQTLAKVQ